MKKYSQFIYKDWELDPSTKKLTLHYSLDDSFHFQESYRFDFDWIENYDPALLDIAIQTLFLLAGVSYYKAYLPPEILINKGSVDEESARFYEKTFQNGLGEFFYKNQLDPHTPIHFPKSDTSKPAHDSSARSGMLVAIGGGKDSLVSIELLRKSSDKIATWSLGYRQALEPLTNVIGFPHFFVDRTIDQQLLDLNKKDAYNGHVPISAIFASVGIIIAVLTGYQDVVVSNENSASDPTLTYQGKPINHQYSKSFEFEKDFQSHLDHVGIKHIRYYSLLRPFTELYISELFSSFGFEKYKHVFSSCNKCLKENRLAWCGSCAKCAFVFLILTPFVKREDLEQLFGGKNLLLDSSLDEMYENLLGIKGDKPLDCVGEVKESRAAMRLAQKIYPELSKYKFDLPTDYDYKHLHPHSIPNPIYESLLEEIKK